MHMRWLYSPQNNLEASQSYLERAREGGYPVAVRRETFQLTASKYRTVMKKHLHVKMKPVSVILSSYSFHLKLHKWIDVKTEALKLG